MRFEPRRTACMVPIPATRTSPTVSRGRCPRGDGAPMTRFRSGRAALIPILLLAIPLLVLGAIVLFILRLWLRFKLWWRGDRARFQPGRVDDEGRQNVRVRMPDGE